MKKESNREKKRRKGRKSKRTKKEGGNRKGKRRMKDIEGREGEKTYEIHKIRNKERITMEEMRKYQRMRDKLREGNEQMKNKGNGMKKELRKSEERTN
jgi:hypothetical protein